MFNWEIVQSTFVSKIFVQFNLAAGALFFGSIVQVQLTAVSSRKFCNDIGKPIRVVRSCTRSNIQ